MYYIDTPTMRVDVFDFDMENAGKSIEFMKLEEKEK